MRFFRDLFAALAFVAMPTGFSMPVLAARPRDLSFLKVPAPTAAFISAWLLAVLVLARGRTWLVRFRGRRAVRAIAGA